MKKIILVDTHAHIQNMVKDAFDQPLSDSEIRSSEIIITEAKKHFVSIFINVGTSLIESKNAILLTQAYDSLFATIGIHPNDCTELWHQDFKKIKIIAQKKEKNRIVGIGECGIDRHYPNYNLARQYNAFRAHIELALTYDLALVIHSRDAYDETLKVIDEYKNDLKKTVMHCFSYDASFANYCIERGFYLGIGGTITYPKNNELRTIVSTMPLENIVLETDAPFLPPQSMRGQKNHPKNIALIAHYIAELRGTSFETIAEQTTKNAIILFGLEKN